MQIELLSFKTIEGIAVQLQFAADGPPAQLYQIGICRGCTKEEVTLMVDYWHRLNAESYALDHPGQQPMHFDMLRIRYGGHPMPVVQFLKWLLFLEWNIDHLAIRRTRQLTGEEEEALEFLKNVIRSVLETLVSRTEEYQKAKFPDQMG